MHLYFNIRFDFTVLILPLFFIIHQNENLREKNACCARLRSSRCELLIYSYCVLESATSCSSAVPSLPVHLSTLIPNAIHYIPPCSAGKPNRLSQSHSSFFPRAYTQSHGVKDLVECTEVEVDSWIFVTSSVPVLLPFFPSIHCCTSLCASFLPSALFTDTPL